MTCEADRDSDSRANRSQSAYRGELSLFHKLKIATAVNILFMEPIQNCVSTVSGWLA